MQEYFWQPNQRLEMVHTLQRIKQLLGERSFPQRDKIIDDCFNLSGCISLSKRKPQPGGEKSEDAGTSLSKLERRLSGSVLREEIGESKAKRAKGAPKKQLPRTADGGAADREGVGGIDGCRGAKRARKS